MRVSHVRPCPADSPLAYRFATLLHVSFVRDVNLANLSRPEIKEHILSYERSTGLNTGILAFDAMPEEESD